MDKIQEQKEVLFIVDEEKKYIPVLVRHDEKGNMKPVAIEWNESLERKNIA